MTNRSRRSYEEPRQVVSPAGCLLGIVSLLTLLATGPLHHVGLARPGRRLYRAEVELSTAPVATLVLPSIAA